MEGIPFVDLPTHYDDVELVRRLLARDEQAFAHVVRAYHGTMLRLARAIVGDTFAEEVVQDTWLAVMRALPGFEARASLRTWILSILSNIAKSRVRHEVRSTAVGNLSDEEDAALPASRFDISGRWRTPPLPWHEETPEALLASDQLRLCLEQAIAALPPLQRAVLILRDVEGMAIEPICNILDVTETNARVLLHRARAHLRMAIEGYEKGMGCAELPRRDGKGK